MEVVDKKAWAAAERAVTRGWGESADSRAGAYEEQSQLFAMGVTRQKCDNFRVRRSSGTIARA